MYICTCTYICALFWQMPINMCILIFFNGIIGKFNYIQLSAIFFDIRKTNIILRTMFTFGKISNASIMFCFKFQCLIFSNSIKLCNIIIILLLLSLDMQLQIVLMLFVYAVKFCKWTLFHVGE